MASRYYGRSRAYQGISADIDAIILTTNKRLLAVMRQSISDVINEAQLATKKGGKMRVDTGFLRASGQASLSGMPQGPGRGEPGKEYPYDQRTSTGGVGATISGTENIIATLGNLQIGHVFYFGWTANYARYRELYDGFLESALRNWGRIVAINTDSLRQRIKK